MSILQAHLRPKIPLTSQQNKRSLLSRFKQKRPAAHGTLLRTHETAGPSQSFGVAASGQRLFL
jgi:hypothetical protein